MELYTPQYFMNEAIKEAKKAFDSKEVPVGAVIVANNKIIGKGHNQTELLNDVTAHAEIIAITAASNYLGAKYLQDCSMFISLEPCLMCAGAIYWSQISNLYIAARDSKRGYTLLEGQILHPKTKVHFGLMESEATSLLKTFFKNLRND